MKVLGGTCIMIHVLKIFPFVFTQPNPCITDKLTNSSHFTVMSVIKRECTHAVSLCVISRSSLSVCRLGPQLWSGRRCWASGSCSPSTWGLVVAFYPPLHPLTPPFLFTATWSSHIYHFQLNQQKAAGKCQGRGTIIHVAQPLMQICLLMKAFWAGESASRQFFTCLPRGPGVP